MIFADLLKGDSFDWLDGSHPDRNSFHRRCTKISPRRYQDDLGFVHHVGSIKARVFHALPRGSEPLAALRHHVTGAIERGEATAIVEEQS